MQTDYQKEMPWDRVKKARKAINVSASQIARELKISGSTYCMYETQRFPPMRTLIYLSNRFGVTTDYILKGVRADQMELNKTFGFSFKTISALEDLKANGKSFSPIETFIQYYAKHQNALGENIVDLLERIFLLLNAET